MTLHEAMVEVLGRNPRTWMDRDELARLIGDEGLYLRGDGQQPPSDQLRLRARKYPHLFEGSDERVTRIPLRTGEASAAPRAGTATHEKAASPKRRRKAGPVTTTARTALDRRQRAARRFKPDEIKLLLIAEAPPAALDRYFYFTEVGQHDSLFRYIVRAVLEAEPTREDKATLLAHLRERGVFLIDLKPDPVDGTPLADYVPALVARVKRLSPGKVILIKAGVYDAAYRALADAGLPVVDERVPFPGSGQQRKFERAFAAALRARPRSC